MKVFLMFMGCFTVVFASTKYEVIAGRYDQGNMFNFPACPYSICNATYEGKCFSKENPNAPKDFVLTMQTQTLSSGPSFPAEYKYVFGMSQSYPDFFIGGDAIVHEDFYSTSVVLSGGQRMNLGLRKNEAYYYVVTSNPNFACYFYNLVQI